MDIAILKLIVSVLKHLCSLPAKELEVIKQFSEQKLSQVFLKVIKDGENAVVEDVELLQALGIQKKSCSVKEVWIHLLDKHHRGLECNQIDMIEALLTRGTLATRMLQYCGPNPSLERIDEMNVQLIESLKRNQMFGA